MKTCECPACHCPTRLDPASDPRIELTGGPALVCLSCIADCLF